jgi:ATP-dependent Zn protease
MNTLPIKYPRNDFFGFVNPRGLFVLTLTILALVFLYLELRHPSPAQQVVSQTQLIGWIKEGGVTQIFNQPDASTGIRYLTGTFSKPGTSTIINFKVPVDLSLDPFLLSELKQAGYKGTIETVNNTNVVWPLFLNLVPVVLFLILATLAVRAIGRWLHKEING